jgi:hypothetical protein
MDVGRAKSGLPLHSRDGVIAFLKQRRAGDGVYGWYVADPETAEPLSFQEGNINMVWLKRTDPAGSFTEDNTTICTWKNIPGVIPPPPTYKRTKREPAPVATTQQQGVLSNTSLTSDFDEIRRRMPELLRAIPFEKMDYRKILERLERQLVERASQHRIFCGCNGKFYRLPLEGPCRLSMFYTGFDSLDDETQVLVCDFAFCPAYRSPVYHGGMARFYDEGIDTEGNSGVFACEHGLTMLKNFEVPEPPGGADWKCLTHDMPILPATSSVPRGCSETVSRYTYGPMFEINGVKRPYFYQEWITIAGDGVFPAF